MTLDERRAFLQHSTRAGKLATVRKDGRPHAVPIWFVLDGEYVVFPTGAHSVKTHALRPDPRACMCVDNETLPYGEFGRRNAVAGELLARLIPTHVVAEADIAV